jgi:serine/threonine protein kinase
MSCYLYHPLKHYGTCKQKLGSGEYGYIRCYTDVEGNAYAVKFHGNRANFLREIMVLMKCKDIPFIVDILDVGYCSNRGKFYHVMPMATGDLFKPIEDGVFRDHSDVLRSTFYQILCAVNALHRFGLMHRDIKAENILVLPSLKVEEQTSSSLKIVLCDFGLAKGFGIPGEIFTDYMLTRCYRSPENHAEEENYGSGVDIWSLGCLFFEMALQRIPFDVSESEKSMQWMWAVLGEPSLEQSVPYFQEVARSLKKNQKKKYRQEWTKEFVEKMQDLHGMQAKEFVLSMFHLDPDQRPSTAALLSHPYFTEHGLQETQVEKEEPEVYQPQDWIRREMQNDLGWSDRNTLFLEMYEVAREHGMMSRVIYKCYALINKALNLSAFEHLTFSKFRLLGYVVLEICSKLYGCESFEWSEHKPLKRQHKALKVLERKVLKAFDFQLDIFTGYDVFWEENLTASFPNYPKDADEREHLRSVYKILCFHSASYLRTPVLDLIQNSLQPTFYEERQASVLKELRCKKKHREFQEDFESVL